MLDKRYLNDILLSIILSARLVRDDRSGLLDTRDQVTVTSCFTCRIGVSGFFKPCDFAAVPLVIRREAVVLPFLFPHPIPSPQSYLLNGLPELLYSLWLVRSFFLVCGCLERLHTKNFVTAIVGVQPTFSPCL